MNLYFVHQRLPKKVVLYFIQYVKNSAYRDSVNISLFSVKVYIRNIIYVKNKT